jgi:hypothetical protein
VLAGFALYGTPEVTRVADGEALLDTPANLGAILAQLVTAEAARLLVALCGIGVDA